MKFYLVFVSIILLSLKLTARQQSFYAPTAKKKEVANKSIKNKQTPYVLNVYDVTGRSVYQLETDSAQLSLSSCTFKKGSYYYIVADRKKKVVKKGEFTVDF